MSPTAVLYVAQAIHGLAYGMLLFLVASGLTMIFGMMGILNIAHASFATLTELEYIRTQEQDAQQASELLTFVKSQPVKWHHTDDLLCSEAAKLKASYKISFADAFVSATAKRINAVLIHKDPELDALQGVINFIRCPPK
jgi:predicted nucleic acid-binding protein